MKIVVVHNAYQHRGGEDSVMEAEADLLASRGHSVEIFQRHNDTVRAMPKAKLALQTMWSLQAGREFEALLDSFKPDVVHVHNTFPLISPSIYWVAHRMGVPVVQTLHNFRLLCPQAVFLRDNRICEDCLGRVPWRGAVRGCYRDSRMQSAVVAGMLTMHRALGTWQSKVTRYIALNEFCRHKFIRGGLPADRIVVKPNFVDFDSPASVYRSGFLFVGRLSAEKGITVLAAAASVSAGTRIRVAGTGPEAARVQNGENIDALGAVDLQSIQTEMSRATALILPSVCYESFPRTVVEAFASRLPVIASRRGPLAELVTEGVTGLLFEPGNSDELAKKIQWAQEHPEQMAEMGRNARTLYETTYTSKHNYDQLMSIYESAILEVNGTPVL